MTWGNDPRVVEPIVGMMMQSRQAVVNYMTPLGLASFDGAPDHHYGPGPWVDDLAAARTGTRPISIARTRTASGSTARRAGSNAVAQYAPQVAACFATELRFGDDYLLWFHHLPWDHRMRYRADAWNELVGRYDPRRRAGRDNAARLAVACAAASMPQRFTEVDAFLGIQEQEAKWWRDASHRLFPERLAAGPCRRDSRRRSIRSRLLQGAELPLRARSLAAQKKSPSATGGAQG